MQYTDGMEAGFRLQQAETYLADLLAWRSGDTERFYRMADSGASPQQWVERIHEIAAEDHVTVRYPDQIWNILLTLESDVQIGATA
ncbi:MAG: hypothetical protein R2867_05475 [Caldilineaceae bacterium]